MKRAKFKFLPKKVLQRNFFLSLRYFEITFYPNKKWSQLKSDLNSTDREGGSGERGITLEWECSF
jgi:hypothetical protein